MTSLLLLHDAHCITLQLKNKVQTLKATLEAASQYHSKEKQKYFQLGDNCQKLREKSDTKVNRRNVQRTTFNKLCVYQINVCPWALKTHNFGGDVCLPGVYINCIQYICMEAGCYMYMYMYI